MNKFVIAALLGAAVAQDTAPAADTTADATADATADTTADATTDDATADATAEPTADAPDTDVKGEGEEKDERLSRDWQETIPG